VLHQLAFTPALDERCRVTGAALGQKSIHVWEEHVHNFVYQAKPVEVADKLGRMDADKLCWIAHLWSSQRLLSVLTLFAGNPTDTFRW
jgi:hypothetical protein